MILESFPTGPLQANCTLWGDVESHEAIIVDPGDEAGRIARRLEQLGLTLDPYPRKPGAVLPPEANDPEEGAFAALSRLVRPD